MAVNLSDIAAMGGVPGHALVSVVGASPDSWAHLYEGILEAATAYSCPVVGGDLSGGAELVVSVALTGWVDGPPVLRSGAQPGRHHLGHRAAGRRRRPGCGCSGKPRSSGPSGRWKWSEADERACPGARPAPAGLGRGSNGPAGRRHRHDRRIRRPGGGPLPYRRPARAWVSSLWMSRLLPAPRWPRRSAAATTTCSLSQCLARAWPECLDQMRLARALSSGSLPGSFSGGPVAPATADLAWRPPESALTRPCGRLAWPRSFEADRLGPPSDLIQRLADDMGQRHGGCDVVARERPWRHCVTSVTARGRCDKGLISSSQKMGPFPYVDCPPTLRGFV